MLILPFSKLSGQIYNYTPIHHSNSEINPSFLASNKNRFTSSFIHQGSFYSKNKFYYDAARVTLYNSKYFTGVGLTVNNTHVNDSASYSYIGAGAAYRTILFDCVYTRIGFMYKLINVNSPTGSFNYYSFHKNGESNISNKQIQNGNISISLSSGRETYYVSAGILNVQLPMKKTDTSGLFPQYYFANVGDLAKILDWESWEISYSVFTKKSPHQKTMALNHYLTILCIKYPITRFSSLRFGGRIGITDSNYVQFNPVLSLYHRTYKRSFVVYQILYDIGIPSHKDKIPYKPSAQFNLTYLF